MNAKRGCGIRSILFWILCISVYGVSLLVAQVPKSEKDIPIFPGATRDMNQESVKKGQMGWEMNQNLSSATLKLYKTGSPLEEVFNFYLQKIGGKAGSTDFDPRTLAAGAVSPIWYELQYYTNEDFEDYEGHSGTLIKQTLTKNRKPHAAGKWLKEVQFNWYKKETNNDGTTFYVIIFDETFDAEPPKFKTATSIEMQITTERSEQAMRAMGEEQMERKTEERTKSLQGKPPTAKDLGAPLYPGALFDADASAGMSLGDDYAYYIFLTTDPPSKVVAFYEQQLKIKAGVNGDKYMIPLKGKLPVPEEGIAVEPNTMFGGNAKTVISIQKRTGKSEE